MRHLFGLFAAFALATVVVNLLLEHVFHYSLYGSIQHGLATRGATAAAIVFLCLLLDVILPIPSSIVMIVSGALFGTLSGGILSMAGSLAGNCLGFELTRKFGEDFLRRHVSAREMEHARKLLERFGPAAIILSRPVPVMMETLSLFAGALRMDRRVFLSASVAGTLPVCLLYAYAGAVSWQGGTLAPAIVAAVLLPAAGWVLLFRGARR